MHRYRRFEPGPVLFHAQHGELANGDYSQRIEGCRDSGQKALIPLVIVVDRLADCMRSQENNVLNLAVLVMPGQGFLR